jgi:hypothetical protein
MKANTYFLTRRNLRDLIIVLSLGSAPFFATGIASTCIALGMLGLGCFIHFVSKGTLIRNIVLSKEGIYQAMRHPYYFANFLIDWSFCQLSGNHFLVLLYPFLFFYSYGPTLRKEEQVLFARHGDTFIKNSLETPRVFPDAGSFGGIKTIFNGFSARRITAKECSRITKLCGIGLLLVLINKIQAASVMTVFSQILSPTISDFDEFLLALFMVVCYFSSSIFHLVSNQSRRCLVSGPSDIKNID